MRLLTAVLCGWLAAAAPAADPPKPNTLTEKQIADGWLLLFDGETTFGWKTEGDVKVEGGALVIGGPNGGTATLVTAFPTALEMSADWTRIGSATAEIGWTKIAAVEKAKNVSVSVAYKEDEIKVSSSQDVDGVKQFTSESYGAITSIKPAPARPLPVKFVAPKGSVLTVSNIKLRPLGLKPLFNAKDLTGWKVYDADPAKAKAKFEVTPAGELHVTGGPGDIQTDAKYADFVLQLEAKTTRPLVNSGVFFRCVPGELQNGYECQIQNAVVGDDRTKPLDYGTGAIYRRVPARKVVSTDGEWFTITLVANGPHFSTWVNGYQTVDWTDDRKPDPNPRKGLRLDAGHLSIQGHAPPTTADVLFRGIKIAEMNAKK